ncbi:hypothetical protein ACFL6C_01850 [Myxococcota bacterium]
MGLVVDTESSTMRRIDLVDGQVAYTTPAFGNNVKHGRFSMDGNNLAYVTEGGTVHICELDGTTIRTFSVWTGGTLSWTQSGIWIGGEGKVVLYDEQTGDLIRQEVPAPPAGKVVKVGTVSHNERSAAATVTPQISAAASLLDQGNQMVSLGAGCSVGPSPNGERFTHNLWEDDYEHQTMKIHDRSGQILEYFYLYAIIPYPEGSSDAERKSFTFNSQSWSSNSNDIILVPTGRGFPQMDDSTMPWIYDLSTQTAYCLAEDPYVWNVWWYIRDYYTGKTGPHPASPVVDAGPDRVVAVATTVYVDATVSDDGFGADPTYAWTQVSGPDPAEIGEPGAVDTSVVFPSVGDYVLRLTVTDGAMAEADDVSFVVEEQAIEITILSPRAGDVLEAGQTQIIEWSTVSITDVVISLSSDDGQTWEPIVGSMDDLQPDWGAYPWQVPNTPSEQCHLRIAGYNREAPTQTGRFEIVGAEVGAASLAPLTASCGASSVSDPTSLSAICLLVPLVAWRRRRRNVRGKKSGHGKLQSSIFE